MPVSAFARRRVPCAPGPSTTIRSDSRLADRTASKYVHSTASRPHPLFSLLHLNDLRRPHRKTSGVVGTLVAVIVAVAAASADGFAPASVQGAKPRGTKVLTHAQQKIDSHLLNEIQRRRVENRKKVPPAPTGVRIDRQRRAYVDIRANVTPSLRRKVIALGATIVSESPEYHSVVAWVPLLKLERLAEDPGVLSIVPVPEATTVK